MCQWLLKMITAITLGENECQWSVVLVPLVKKQLNDRPKAIHDTCLLNQSEKNEYLWTLISNSYNCEPLLNEAFALKTLANLISLENKRIFWSLFFKISKPRGNFQIIFKSQIAYLRYRWSTNLDKKQSFFCTWEISKSRQFI